MILSRRKVMPKANQPMAMWIGLLVGLCCFSPAQAGDLLNEDFADGFGALVPTGDVERFEGTVTLPLGGAIASRNPIDGDIAVTIRLRDDLSKGRLLVGLGNGGLEMSLGALDPSFLTEGQSVRLLGLEPDDVGGFQAPPPTKVVIRNRSDTIEVEFDGRVVFSRVTETPVGGGVLTISAIRAAARLDSIQVERLGWFDGVQVEGLGDERMTAARALNPTEFRLLDPQPSRIDPEYKFTWLDADGASVDPVTVRYAGIRPEEDDAIPMLTQALALAGIRPHLDVKVWDGEGPDDKLPLTASDDGTYRLDKGPGLIEAATLTWMGDVWPTATAWDVTNDRLLDRCVPAGPARRDLWTHIPDDCDEVKITLAGPGTPTVEQVIRITR